MLKKYPINPEDIEEEKDPPRMISGESGGIPSDVNVTRSSTSCSSPFSISGCDDHDDARFSI
jgi:hypothetical protein